ncbi:MAG: sugar transferase [Candidatus Zixiibacteriota bacterium]
MQRLFDIILATGILVISSPVWLLATVALLIFDFGSPFFLHQRIGKDGKPFRLVKFRTMRARKEAGSNLTVSGDARITGVGRVLRRLKIDELPQLLNVLSGSMSMVGPRLETPEFVAIYSAEQREILSYRPGLTDPASIKYRHEELVLAGHDDPIAAYKSIVLPDKISMSLEYQKRRSLGGDLAIIGHTIGAIFHPPPKR